MKNLLILVLFIVPVTLCGSNLIDPLNKSKEKPASNLSLFVDGGTFGIGYSAFFNVEKYLSSSKSDKIHLYFRGSCGEVRYIGSSNSLTIGGSITMITGSGNHHFDSSTGLLYRDQSILPFLDLGYRYQKLDGGIILKGKIGLFGLGLGIGYSF